MLIEQQTQNYFMSGLTQDSPLLENLKTFDLFKALDGSGGRNRAPQEKCQINAKNDLDAINTWLNEYKHKKTTYRTYKKAAERLLLWSIIQCQKPLSGLNRDDFESFDCFLSDPQPREQWCCRKNIRRGQSGWRPMCGPLSDSSKQTVLLSIKSLMNYLVQARYLEANPLCLIKKKASNQNRATEAQLKLPNKMLEEDEWNALIDTLNEMPEETISQQHKKIRLRFIISILGYLGLRISELASHQWSAFFKKDERWWMLVYGKGDKLRTVAINNHFLTEMIGYRRHFGLSAFPQKDEKTPLLVSIYGEKAVFSELNIKTIRNLIKKLTLKAAEKFKDRPDKARKLRKFSPHSLRHTSASMQYYAGINPQHTKENLGHSSLEMTAYYQHSLDKARHEDMMKLKLRVR